MSRARSDHVIQRSPMTFACLHCGASYELNVPAPIGIVVAASRAFIKEHRACTLTERGVACSFCFGFGHTTDACPNTEYGGSWRAWADGPDTGFSSLALCRRLAGAPVQEDRFGDGRAHPWDPSDFGRCHRMLSAFPAFRATLHKARDLSPVWARLIDAWDELERLYLEELPTGRCPKLYARMKELIRQ